MRARRPAFLSVALGLLTLGTAAIAQQAQPAQAAFSGIDPNTFILGHPASPRWVHVRANQEHPAVLVARRAREVESLKLSSIDPNQFIVQPPSTVRWLAASETTPVLVAAQAR